MRRVDRLDVDPDERARRGRQPRRRGGLIRVAEPVALSNANQVTSYDSGAVATPAATAALPNVSLPEASSTGSMTGFTFVSQARPIASRRAISVSATCFSAAGSLYFPDFTTARIMSSVNAITRRAPQNVSSDRARRNAGFGTRGFQSGGWKPSAEKCPTDENSG